MGKKAKLKQLKKLAANLPELKKERVHGERITAAELVKQGVYTVDGKTVKPGQEYREKVKVQVPINHERNMKALLKRFGPAAVNRYAAAVVNKAHQEERTEEQLQQDLQHTLQEAENELNS